jgi:hypothetical protein
MRLTLRNGWIRWRGGVGMSWTTLLPLFSERNGYQVPFLRLFNVRVFWLPRVKGIHSTRGTP